jgi:hypothetical protein
MTTPSTDAEPAPPHDSPVELFKEGLTMALYVAVCLLAALAALPDDPERREVSVFVVIWGTTVGLALAHWFAFSLSARLVAAGTVRRHDAAASVAQLVGAVAVAVLATVPVLFLGEGAELSVVRFVLAGFIAVVGFAVARSSGAATHRAATYAVVVLVVAGTIVTVKHVLSGH